MRNPFSKKERWALIRTGFEGGRVIIAEFETPQDQDSVSGYMSEPGNYSMQKRAKNGNYGEKAWSKKVQVEDILGGEGEAEPKRGRRQREVIDDIAPDSEQMAAAIEQDLNKAFRWLAIGPAIQKAMENTNKNFGGILGGASGGGNGKAAFSDLKEGESFDEYLSRKMKSRDDAGESWAKSHGYSQSDGTFGSPQNITVDGKIPAYLVVAPKIIDGIMDSVEKRAVRMGLISSDTVEKAKKQEARSESMLKAPDKLD